MELTRQGDQISQDVVKSTNDYIIPSNQGVFKKIISFFFTSIMWLYTLSIFILFASAIVDYNNDFIGIIKELLKVSNASIRNFLFWTFLFFVASFSVLFIWRVYNKKRFGKLNRRVAPQPTTETDLLALGLMDLENFEKLSTGRYILFSKNPIKDLYEGEQSDQTTI